MLNTCHLLVSTVAAAEEDLPMPCYEYNVGILACGLCGVVYLTEKSILYLSVQRNRDILKSSIVSTYNQKLIQVLRLRF